MTLYFLRRPRGGEHWTKLRGSACPQTFSRRTLVEENRKITLKAYSQEHQTRMEAISCALIFEHFRARRMLRPIKRASSQVASGDLHKTNECHPKQKGHMIEECIKFKNMVCLLLDMDSTTNSWGDGVINARDEPQLDIPLIERTIFYLAHSRISRNDIGGLFRIASK